LSFGFYREGGLKKFSVVMICSLFFASLASWNTAAAIDVAEPFYKTGYTCFDDNGKARWTATMEIINPSGSKKEHTLIEKGEGRYYGFKDDVSWVATLECEKKEGTLRPLNMERDVFDSGGQKIRRDTQKYDFNKNEVVCVREDLVKNKKTKKTFSFERDVVTRIMLGLYVQQLLEKGKTEQEVSIISDEPALYSFSIKMLGEEKIYLNGITKMAYKLCYDPDIGVLNMFKSLLPKAYTWHSTVPRFEWLKYTGKESSLASPTVEVLTLDK